MSQSERGVLDTPGLGFVLAIVVVIGALILRQAMTQYLEVELPPFFTFYPAIMLIALVTGFWVGLMATVLASLLASYWIFKPLGNFLPSNKADTVALAFFFGMGVFMSVVASRYRHYQRRAASYKREQALRESTEKLRQSEEKFETLANAIPQLCWMANPDGGIFWYNQRWYDYTGTTAKEMEGRGWQSVHDPKFLPRILKEWNASVASGEPFKMVFPLRGADGLFRPFLTRVMPLKDSENKVVRWFGTNTDISDQKRIEEELRESKERLDLAIEVADLGEWELNLKDRVGVRSLRHSRIFGYSSFDPKWSFTQFVEHVLPEYRAEVLERFTRSEARGIWDFETQIRRVDGEVRWIWVRGRSVLDETGEPARVFGTVVDITSRKQVEEALRRSEERWATTLQSIGDAVISTDAVGSVVFMNEIAQRLTGWTLQEAEGRNLSAVLHLVQGGPVKEGTRTRSENPVDKVLRRGKMAEAANHTVLIHRDGTEVPIVDSAAPILGRKGEIEGVVLVFHDVTEQRRAEKLLRDSERLATTGRLAATIAHEIHNPLDAVGNLLYLIGKETKDQSIQDYVSVASTELARVTQITRQMLTFQREATKPIPVRINEILDSALGLYGRKLALAGIRLESRMDCHDEILALPGELRQVFANLIGNAIEASKAGQGRIWVHARGSRDWSNGRLGVRVVVADNGAGIPPEIRGKIFDPFFTTKGESGTGLGLWITSEIVRKNQGTLRLWSSVQEGHSGTCFSVFLPVQSAQALAG